MTQNDTVTKSVQLNREEERGVAFKRPRRPHAHTRHRLKRGVFSTNSPGMTGSSRQRPSQVMWQPRHAAHHAPCRSRFSAPRPSIADLARKTTEATKPTEFACLPLDSGARPLRQREGARPSIGPLRGRSNPESIDRGAPGAGRSAEGRWPPRSFERPPAALRGRIQSIDDRSIDPAHSLTAFPPAAQQRQTGDRMAAVGVVSTLGLPDVGAGATTGKR